MQPDEVGLDAVGEIARRLIENLETVVHGKSREIRLVLSALLAGGHVLLEDVPGTAKTILARSIAASVDGIEFSRIQCTAGRCSTSNEGATKATDPKTKQRSQRSQRSQRRNAYYSRW